MPFPAMKLLEDPTSSHPGLHGDVTATASKEGSESCRRLLLNRGRIGMLGKQCPNAHAGVPSIPMSRISFIQPH